MGSITIPDEVISEILRLCVDTWITSDKFEADMTDVTILRLEKKMRSADSIMRIYAIWGWFHNMERKWKLDPDIHSCLVHICKLLETVHDNAIQDDRDKFPYNGVDRAIQVQRESLITMITDEIMNSIV